VAARDSGELAAQHHGELSSEHPTVTFADVAGLSEAVAELREVKEYLADPHRYAALGAELPRGMLLCGPPGNGKTLLARALAGEAGVPFYFVSAASFVEQFVGLGAARVRSFFEQAKRHAPSIVFIDELDAIGGQRSAAAAGGREFDHTLNQLLIELDGFASTSDVLILGATNRPELLDAALVRPGRFDRRIQVDRPDLAGREAILRLHASRRPFSPDVDWAEVAHQTTGLTGAELANTVNEACLLAARRYRTTISSEEVEEAIARVTTGARTSRLIGEEEKRLLAYHEAGHAVLSLLLRGIKPPPRVSIVARASALNRSPWSVGDDREVLTKRELVAQLMVLLGGRAAEINTFGEPSTRAEDDLDEAAKLARKMVERWAMTGKFHLAGRSRDHDRHVPMGTDSDVAVGRLLGGAEQAARMILGDNSARLRAVAEALVDRETLTIAEIAERSGCHAWRSEMGVPAARPAVSAVARLHG
jgi:cell division protease FtsH